MKNFSTSTLTSSIIVASLLISPISKGEEYTYNPSADLGGKFSTARNITEFNYMHPLLDSGDILPIIDLKLKLDNHKSKEINLGFALRHNYEDKAILGAYAYFDHRQTASKFSVSALTAGVEVLSKYVDARANIYLPQSKKKKVAHRNISVERQGTSIFVLSGGHTYESGLKGYDIEIGTPVFGFSDELNEKIGTKIHVARYSFKGKNTKLVAGTRFRLEQDIATFWSGNNSYNFYMNAETQFDKVRKRQNFIGLGLKVIFGDKVNIGKKHANKLDHRMMETIIRDVDQVVLPYNENAIVNNFFQGSQKIDKNYYVASYENPDHKGDGTEPNPYSFEQLKDIDCTDALVVVTKVGGKKMTMQEIDQLKDIPNLAGHGHDIHLNAAGHEFVVQDKDGVSINAQGALTTNLLGEARHKEVKLQKLYAIVNAQKIAHKMVNRFHERKAARKAGAKSVADLISARVEAARKVTKIQAAFRKHTARVKANAATKIQTLARKRAAQQAFIKTAKAAKNIQAAFRGHTARVKANAATKIQTLARKRAATKIVENVRKASKKDELRKKNNNRRNQQKKNKHKELQIKKANAATMIQTLARKRAAQQAFIKTVSGITKFQAAFRGHTARVKAVQAAREEAVKANAATKIQTLARKMAATKIVENVREQELFRRIVLEEKRLLAEEEKLLAEEELFRQLDNADTEWRNSQSSDPLVQESNMQLLNLDNNSQIFDSVINPVLFDRTPEQDQQFVQEQINLLLGSESNSEYDPNFKDESETKIQSDARKVKRNKKIAEKGKQALNYIKNLPGTTQTTTITESQAIAFITEFTRTPKGPKKRAATKTQPQKSPNITEEVRPTLQTNNTHQSGRFSLFKNILSALDNHKNSNSEVRPTLPTNNTHKSGHVSLFKKILENLNTFKQQQTPPTIAN